MVEKKRRLFDVRKPKFPNDAYKRSKKRRLLLVPGSNLIFLLKSTDVCALHSVLFIPLTGYWSANIRGLYGTVIGKMLGH